VRYFWVLAVGLLAILAFGALPSDTQGAVTRQAYLPYIVKEPTPTPTRTPTPTPTPAVPAFQYRAFVQNDGWQDWKSADQEAGTTGQAKAIQALQFRMTSGPSNAVLKYRAHVANQGWTDYHTSAPGQEGAIVGRTDPGFHVEAIQVGFENVSGYYVGVEPYVADWGWMGAVRDFWVAGTTSQGRRIEAIKANVRTSPPAADVRVAYNAWVEGGTDYAGWRHDGEEAGTTGQSKRLERFKVLLFNKPEGMSIQYRCKIQDVGWTEFRDAGADCGDIGRAIYGFEMRFTSPYGGSVLSYRGHFANLGWVQYASDNPSSNPVLDSGNNRLEAMSVDIGHQTADQRR
jgi:uncharacterized protein YjdB